MKISEIKDGMSIKYEAIRLKNEINKKVVQESYTLIGMFMELPKVYQGGNGRTYQKEGKFIGYKKGSNQLQEVKVYFHESDEVVIKELDRTVMIGSLPMNINRLSATRMPKVISDHLKRLHKQYQEEIKYRDELQRLAERSKVMSEKSKQVKGTITTLTQEIAKSLRTEVKAEVINRPKNPPDFQYYTRARQLLYNYSGSCNMLDLYVEDGDDFSLKVVIGLYGNYGSYFTGLPRKKDNPKAIDFVGSYKKLYKVLREKDKHTVDYINNGLSKIKDVQYEVRFNDSQNTNYTTQINAYYKIKFNEKLGREQQEELIKQIGRVFIKKS